MSLRWALLAGVAITAWLLALIAYATGGLSGLERMTVDARFRIRGSEPTGARVVIVGLDQKSLASFNAQLPISRLYYAQLLDRLRAAHPRVIAVDVQFIGAGRDAAGDRALLAAVARDGPVLLATHDTDAGPIPVPAGRRNAQGAVLASVGVPSDSDNVVRRMAYAPVALKTFAVRAAELFEDKPISSQAFPDNSAWIDFRGPPGTFPTYSFVDMLAGRVPDETLAGHAVLVGVTDPAAKDVFVTAGSSVPMSGVELNANALTTILDGFPLKPLTGLLSLLLLAALAALPAIISARLTALYMFLASLGIITVFMGLAQFAFTSGTIVPVLSPLLGLILSSVGSTGVEIFIEKRQRQALEAALGRLLPPPSPHAFFICYRRDQNGWAARALRDELAKRFGVRSVFMDTTSISAGQEWAARIHEAIRGCSVMLVLIGPYWLEAKNSDGTRRIDDPHDLVRIEIEAGLRRSDAAVVPVLLDGAKAPDALALPESLTPLSRRQATTLTGEHLSSEIDALVDSIEDGRVRDAILESAVYGDPPS